MPELVFRQCMCSHKEARHGWCLSSTNRMNSGVHYLDCIDTCNSMDTGGDLRFQFYFPFVKSQTAQ